jgi:hypothetical protein
MKRGILFQNKHSHPAAVAVAMALRQYLAAEHTQGYEAREVHFHPSEKPKEAVLAGLKVCIDKEMKPGFIRVTTDVEEPVEAL